MRNMGIPLSFILVGCCGIPAGGVVPPSLAGAICLLVAAVPAFAAAAPTRPQPSVRGVKAPQAAGFVLSPGIVLYDQTGGQSGNGYASQDFEPALDPFDCQGADDFVIPAGASWSITGAAFPGHYVPGSTPMTAIHVFIYNDAAGQPGTAACSYPNTPPATDVNGVITIDLTSTPCDLPSGTYWISAQTRMDLGVEGQWLWISVLFGFNGPAKWQNPGGGFGVGCLSWTDLSTCLDGDPSFAFQLTGTAVPVELQDFTVE